MNKIYIDTEFNGFGGQLLSMALVPEDKTKPEFYRELQFSGQLDPWVKANVIPHFFMAPVSHSKFQSDLSAYLLSMGDCMIIADWPDDIKYFCESLIAGPGQRITTPTKIKFELDLNIRYTSEVPHNALYDARAIRDTYQLK